MTREEAKQVFLSRGYIEVEGGTIYDADKWRESCRVISEWLEQEPYDDARYHEEHGEIIVDKAVWEDAKRALEQEPAYCDRNICLKNEYNGIGCDECEVTKSQEPKTQMVDKSNFDIEQYKMDLQCAYDCGRASVEPSGDAVSRQAVLDLAKFDERKGLGTIIHALDVEQLPSVKPQPKTGHWIEHPEIKTIAPEYIMFYECSECGDIQCFCKSDIHRKRFCNYCGARMVEPQESEDKE